MAIDDERRKFQTADVCNVQYGAVEKQFSEIKADIEKIFDKLDRLPNWAVALIGLLTAFIGWLVKGN